MAGRHVLRVAVCHDARLKLASCKCRELLAAPVQEASELLQGRMPVPKLLECDQGGSQACLSNLPYPLP
jgi:hypothetical protein